MNMRKTYQNIAKAFGLILMLIFNSCASITGFEEGRTNGEEVHSLLVSANYTYLPDLSEGSIIGDSGGAPMIEASYKYGIKEKLDIGIRANTFLNLAVNGKYQLVGDQQSNFALASGLELGIFAGLSVWNVQIPLFASIYPKDNICIYLNPRYIFQTAGAQNEGANYLGTNFGILIGKKNKLGIDLAYYNVGASNEFATMLNFGVGGKFVFGNGN